MQLFKSTNYYLRMEPRQEKHEDFAKERHDFLHEKVVDFNAVPRPKQDHFAKERQDAFLNQKVANFNSFHVASPVHSPVPTPVFFHTPPPSTPKPDCFGKERQANFMQQRVADINAAALSPLASPNPQNIPRERHDTFLMNQKGANLNSIHAPSPDSFAKERHANFIYQRMTNINSQHSPVGSPNSYSGKERLAQQKTTDKATMASPKMEHFAKDKIGR